MADAAVYLWGAWVKSRWLTLDSLKSWRMPPCSCGGLGGLSVEGTSPFFHQESYQEDTQMSQWGDMLADEQPKLFKPLAELNHNGRALAKTVKTAKNNLVFGKPE